MACAPVALHGRVVQLGVRVAELFARHEELEPLRQLRKRGRQVGSGRTHRGRTRTHFFAREGTKTLGTVSPDTCHRVGLWRGFRECNGRFLRSNVSTAAAAARGGVVCRAAAGGWLTSGSERWYLASGDMVCGGGGCHAMRCRRASSPLPLLLLLLLRSDSRIDSRDGTMAVQCLAGGWRALRGSLNNVTSMCQL